MYSQTLLEVVRILDDADLRYLIVGGFAVIAHGYLRLTTDVDLVLDFADEAGLRRFLRGLAAAGFRPRVPVPIEAFAERGNRESWQRDKEMVVFSLRREGPPRQDEIDLFLEAPFDFEEAWSVRHIEGVPGGITMAVVDRERLFAMKRKAGRLKDLADLDVLERMEGWNPNQRVEDITWTYDAVEMDQRHRESSQPFWNRLLAVDGMLEMAAMINPRVAGHLAPVPTPAPARRNREEGPSYEAGAPGPRPDLVPLPALRQRRGLKQGELAERMGCSKSAVSQFERNRSVTTDMLKRYLAGLGAQLELVARFEDGSEVPLRLVE